MCSIRAPAVLRAVAAGVLMVALMALPLAAQDDVDDPDPFGDPFAGTPPAAPPAPPETRVELSGELRYQPALHVGWAEGEEKYEEPTLVSGDVEADLDVAVSRGLLSFTGAFTATTPTPAGASPETDRAVAVRELYARRIGEYSDITVGYFDPNWSSFDFFPVLNFFDGVNALFLNAAGSAGVTGLRAIGYVGPFTGELIVVPLPRVRDSGLTTAAEIFGYSPYPPEVPVTVTEPQPSRTFEEVHVAGRLGASFGPVALYVAGYRGYPTREVRESVTTFDATAAAAGENPLSVAVTAVRPMVTTVAAAASAEVLGAVVEVEAAFTWDDPLAVSVINELPPPVGEVTDRAIETAHTVAVAGRLDWELVPNTRILAEVTDFVVIDAPENLDEAMLPGTSIFAGVDILVPAPQSEFGLTVGPICDWSGRELTMVGRVRADLLNGVTSELTVAYLTVGDAKNATSDFALSTDHDVLLSLSVAYSF